MASNETLGGSIADASSPDTALLEALVPGYRIISHFFMSYLKIDINGYLQILIGFALLVGCIKYLHPTAMENISDLIISTAEIRMEDEVFNYMMYWISRQSHMKRTSRFLASLKFKHDPWADSDESDFEDEDSDDESWDGSKSRNNTTTTTTTTFDDYWAKMMNRDKYKSINFTPSEGSHYFRYRGHLIKLRRTEEQNRPRNFGRNERLWLSCLGKNPEILRQLLLEAQKAYIERDGNRTLIYRAKRDYDRSFSWIRCMSRSPRPMSSVILNQAQKQEFVDDMREYLHPKTRRWYFDRGIPYRRGYLLHGPPGTGKTSLCFAAAGLLRLKLYLLNLKTNGLDEESMSSLFASLPRRCIVLLEDIDTAGITKTRGKTVTPGDNPAIPAPNTEISTEGDFDESSKDTITLSGLLNVIDGVAASEGRILVMTTNHPDKLDPALLRPGRVDMSISFGYMSDNDIKELFASMYRFIGNGPRQANGPVKEKVENDEDSTREQEKRDVSLDARISNLCVSFAQAIPTGELTAAEIQGYLLNHKDKPEAAVAGVAQWVEEMRKNRET
ncbi:hypothetical protein N7509_009802 [Penicillium cosmopolitanum]|uniref:AAA+ ATPase domain-containing protein n=1 Tax=Penicillium cosmopolitanum TaxID=1131564 RepID=A0A9X0B408_9EURO|nr:uncharacterized protein N7509_009802 [Penicillium cosmopolitanum]KAJ5387261.1 hypothetical protein N7509_009802 [Penicillium cosmopolitanum]